MTLYKNLSPKSGVGIFLSVGVLLGDNSTKHVVLHGMQFQLSAYTSPC